MAKTRKDGWPLCPRCDEDELYCLLDHSHRMPQGCPGMACYRCYWHGPDPRTMFETTDAPGYSTTALIPRAARVIYAEYAGSDPT